MHQSCTLWLTKSVHHTCFTLLLNNLLSSFLVSAFNNLLPSFVVRRVDLEDAYGGEGMAVLDCRGKVHLNQVYLCLEPDPETHLPGEQVCIRLCITLDRCACLFGNVLSEEVDLVVLTPALVWVFHLLGCCLFADAFL